MKEEVESYIRKQPQKQQTILKHFHQLCIATIPNTEESISYKIIGYQYLKKKVIYLSSWKNHISIHGGKKLSLEVKKKYPQLKVVGSTIQFPLDSGGSNSIPVSDDIIRDILRIRLEIYQSSNGKE